MLNRRGLYKSMWFRGQIWEIFGFADKYEISGPEGVVLLIWNGNASPGEARTAQQNRVLVVVRPSGLVRED